MQRSYIITIILLIIALIFTFQNTATAPIKFLGWNFEGSVALVTIIIFFSGFVGGWFIGWSNVWKKNVEIRALKKQIVDLSKTDSPSSK